MALKLGEYKCAVDEYRAVLAAQGAELAAKPQMRTVLLAKPNPHPDPDPHPHPHPHPHQVLLAKLQEAEAAEAASWKQAFMAEAAAAAAEEEAAAAAEPATAAAAGAAGAEAAAAGAEVAALEAQLALGARVATPEQAAEP